MYKKFNLPHFYKIFIIISVIFLFTGKTYAVETISEGDILDLTRCIEIALQNNPNISIYQNQKKISKSRVGQAKSDYFPQLGINTGYYGQNNSHSNVSGNDDYYSADISLNQLIFNFGKTSANVNAQKYNLEASEFNEEYQILDTVYNVKSAYYAVLAARANKDIYTENVDINKRQHERTKAFFEEGLKSKIDLVNAEVNLSDSKIELVKAENSYQNSLIKLNNSMYITYAPKYSIENTETFNLTNRLTPVSLTNIADVKENKSDDKNPEKATVYSLSVQKTDMLKGYVFKPFELSLEKTIELAHENRPDIKAFAATLKAKEQALKLAQRQYYPTLSGKVGYGIKNTDYFFNNGLNFSAGLEIPITNAMDTKCKIDEAKAELEIAKSNLDLLKKNIYFEVQGAYVDMLQLEKQIPLMEVKVRQALENFELADGRYEVGLGNFIELQDAKVNYNNAQHSYVQAIYDFNVARAKLEKSMGVQ